MEILKQGRGGGAGFFSKTHIYEILLHCKTKPR